MRWSMLVPAMATILGAAIVTGDDATWSRFRGPQGSGVADNQKPPVDIGPNKNVKWKIAVPAGLSSPIVAGGNLVITGFENGKLFTIAYRRTDGTEAWRAEAEAKQIEKFHKVEGSPAASTPATDGQRIVSYFGSCGLVCYDLQGKQLWRFELPPVSLPGDFGSGVSPILVDGVVILVRDQLKDSKIYALDAATGSLKWDITRVSPGSYCTPVVWDTPTGKQVVAAGHARMVGYDLASGKEQWSVIGMPSACCASPVIADGVLYFAGTSGSGEGEEQMPPFDSILKDLDKDKDGAISRAEGEKAFAGFFDNQDMNKDGRVTRDEWETIMRFFAEGKDVAFALKPGGTGDITASHILWSQTKGLPYIPSVIFYRGQLLIVRDGGILTAYEAASGKQLYTQRVAASGRYYASPVAANGNLYLTALEKGIVTVVKAGAEKPEVVATSEPFEERIAATPAIADDSLYLRTEKNLYAFSEKK